MDDKMKDKLKDVYERQKPTNLRDVLTDDDWIVDDASYDEKTGKYNFKIRHKDGRQEELSRNRQYCDNLIKELLYVKRKKRKSI